MAGVQDHRDRVMGLHYHLFIQNLHEQLAPKTYLEIGVRKGLTFEKARCASIGIDPKFMLTRDVAGMKPMCLLFQQTSDQFFEHRDPSALLGGPLDMAFIDGMHLSEFVLRDFINIERHCRPNSIILLHDCLPPHPCMISRDATAIAGNPPQYHEWWTGDVWKLIPILRQHRPDLQIALIDCMPTGLAMITNLDPQSNVLTRAYAEITTERPDAPNDEEEFERFWDGLEITPSSSMMGAEQLLQRYRLDVAASP
jgi:hypothetical protein